MDAETADLRRNVALACRILAQQGLVREIIGHVSARVPGAREMLIRCRGDDEYGLAFTTAEAIRRVDFDGGGPGRGDRHVTPLELPIHGEIYKARPDTGAVVHAHPEAVLLCGLAGIELRPIFGAYDPDALEVAAAGVPVFPRSVLIDGPRIAGEMIAAMAGGDVCLLRGHGITVIGRTVEQATLRALKLEALARVTWQLAAAGRDIPPLRAEEVEAFTSRSQGGVIPGGERWLWHHYVRLLENAGGLAPLSSPLAGDA
ncbi:MAG: class II aldolase/adducin family protein [Chloroflexi bacterium]|nr:class II aldolase/adducin family protein [Chloroflexota bacterium]